MKWLSLLLFVPLIYGQTIWAHPTTLKLKILGQEVQCVRQKSAIDDNKLSLARNSPCELFICDSLLFNGEKFTPVLNIPFSRNPETGIFDSNYENARIDFINNEKIILNLQDFQLSDADKLVYDVTKWTTPMETSLSKEFQQGSKIYALKAAAEALRSAAQMRCRSDELTSLSNLRLSHLNKFKEKRVKAALKVVVGAADFLGRNTYEIQVDDCYISSKGNWEKVKKDLDQVNQLADGRIISESEAQLLFKEVQNMSDLDFSLQTPTRDKLTTSVSGCEARAHIIADRLSKKGAYVGKVWFHGEKQFPRDKEELRPKLGGGWEFHVAPFVVVKADDGKLYRYVLDPASASRAIKVSEFEQNIRPIQGGMPMYVPSDSFPAGILDWPRLMITFTEKERYLPLNQYESADMDKMKQAWETIKYPIE